MKISRNAFFGFSGLILAGLGFLVYESAVVIYPDEQVLILQFGDHKATVNEPGLYFKTPFIQNVKYFDKRLLTLDISPEEVIVSGQERIVVGTLSRFYIRNPLDFYRTVGNRAVADSRLAGLVRSAMRRILGTQDLLTVLSTKRRSLMEQIGQAVNKEALPLGIEVLDVRIQRADLPEENSEAVYRRMQTEREKEAKEIRALGKEIAQQIRAVADKKKEITIAKAQEKSEITRGEGDRLAASIYNDVAQRDPGFYTFYRTLEMYKTGLIENDEKSTLVLPHPLLNILLED